MMKFRSQNAFEKYLRNEYPFRVYMGEIDLSRVEDIFGELIEQDLYIDSYKGEFRSNERWSFLYNNLIFVKQEDAIMAKMLFR